MALLIALLVLLVQDHADAENDTDSFDVPVMQWTPCALDNNSVALANDLSAQCATLMLPLCYDSACQHDQENATIAVSFKRIGASNSSVSRQTLWYLPDRPDVQTRDDVDVQMALLFEALHRDVDIYTLDMRGTGNSTALACESSIDGSAVQTAVFARNNGVLEASDVRTCVDRLQDSGYSDLGAFSLTSASRDVEEVLRRFQAESKAVVYALGYGTLVAQQLMHHRNVSQVVGYVLDGALGGGLDGAAPSTALPTMSYHMSKSDEDFGEVAADFLAWCERDGECSMRFPNATLTTTLRAKLGEAYLRLDTDTTSTCATILTDVETSSRRSINSATFAGATPPSYVLRQLLGLMVRHKRLWPFVPVVVHRFHRCGAEDLLLLTRFVSSTFALDDDADTPELLYAIQSFSELWESPPPDQVVLTERFTNQSISSGRTYTQLEAYCLFTGSNADACTTPSAGTSSGQLPVAAAGSTLSYAGEPMHTSALARPSASVLLLSGRLDVVSPPKYASALFDSIPTANKALLVAAYSPHKVLQHALASNGDACARRVLASYVFASGNLSAYDASCMATLPTPSLAISRALSQSVLGVEDAYDGVLVHSSNSNSSNSSEYISGTADVSFDSSGSDTSAASGPTRDELQRQISTLTHSRARYELALIVVASALGAVVVVLAVVVIYRRRQKQQHTRDDLATLRRLHGDGDSEVELMGSIYLLSTSPTQQTQQTNEYHVRFDDA
ncbi:unnamed protein product [Hyaloperonospora brassicae]|nr:unnamed protein product [Hyaloperonospora brassicae]